jgi:hypothetical protein
MVFSLEVTTSNDVKYQEYQQPEAKENSECKDINEDLRGKLDNLGQLLTYPHEIEKFENLEHEQDRVEHHPEGNSE